MAQGAKIQNGVRTESRLGGSSSREEVRFRFGCKVKGSENLRRRGLNLRIDQNHECIWQPDRRAELVADTPDRSGLWKKTGKDVRPGRPSRSLHARITNWQPHFCCHQP